MILELDCGNSLVKWRVLDWRGSVLARGASATCAELIEAIERSGVPAPSVCRMVSVRAEAETEQVRDAVAQTWQILVHQAQPAARLAGVCNGYDDYRRLGLDRWLAVAAAFELSGRGCLVLDLGTAVTADYVTAQGQHLGGFICPGVRMMCGELRMHTQRIHFSGDQADAEFRRPGSNTGDAVRRGSVLMLRAFVVGQLDLASSWLGESFEVFVTGGDAELILDIVPHARFLPDLVFLGLAQACPLVEAQ